MLAAAILASMAQTAGTSAGAVPVKPLVVKASAAELLQLAEYLWTGGRRSEAEELLRALSGDADRAVRNEARARLAAIFEMDGSRRAAAILLREIVDEDPRASSARLKLATLLQSFGDEESARRELRAIRYSDLPIEAARFADRLTALLQARRPFGVQLELALAPDSNMNLGPRAAIVPTVLGDFVADRNARSGLGAAARIFMLARVPLSRTVDLQIRSGADARLYRDKAFDDIAADFAIAPQLDRGRTRLRFEASIAQQWLGLRPVERTLRATGMLVRSIGRTSQLRIDAGRRWSDNRMNDRQDGRGLFVRTSFERALSATTAAVASFGIERFEARDDAYSSFGWNGGVTLYRELGRMTLNGGVSIARLEMDERIALFLEPRSDRALRLHAGATYRQLSLGGFAPFTRLVIERNRSSLAVYDYKRTRTEFGLTRAF